MSNKNNDKAYSENSLLGQRISKIADRVGGKKALAVHTSISESQLYRYINNESQPTAQPLAAIAKIGDVSLDWLITGQYTFRDHHIDRQAANNILVEIPLFDTSPYSNYHLSNKVLFNTNWLKEHHLTTESLRLLPMLGDSMQPSIQEHDLLIVDIDQTTVQTDAIYVLNIDNDLIAKRLQHNVDGGIIIRSDNCNYQPQHADGDKTNALNVIGRVVWHAGLL